MASSAMHRAMRGIHYPFFRHGDAPKIGRKYDHLELSDSAKCVIWLVKRLPKVWTCIYMDNLNNSQKLFSALYLAESLGHGVVCATGWGICNGIKQLIELNAKKAEALKGTMMAAQLCYLKDCPDFLAVCVCVITNPSTFS